jgi:hypothetical protein
MHDAVPHLLKAAPPIRGGVSGSSRRIRNETAKKLLISGHLRYFSA